MKICIKCNIEKDVSEFYPGRNACKVCEIARSTAYREANPEKVKAAQQAWKESDFEKYTLLYKNYNRKNKTGWTPERFLVFNYAQGGLCYICGEPGYGRDLNVDHDHDTGEQRCLLCSNCNTAIGLLRDSSSLAIAVVSYLERYA